MAAAGGSRCDSNPLKPPSRPPSQPPFTTVQPFNHRMQLSTDSVMFLMYKGGAYVDCASYPRPAELDMDYGVPVDQVCTNVPINLFGDAFPSQQ